VRAVRTLAGGARAQDEGDRTGFRFSRNFDR